MQRWRNKLQQGAKKENFASNPLFATLDTYSQGQGGQEVLLFHVGHLSTAQKGRVEESKFDRRSAAALFHPLTVSEAVANQLAAPEEGWGCYRFPAF